MKKAYNLSIRCYFEGSTTYTHHIQTMPLADIAKWIEAYQFTHPTLDAITVKVYIPKGDTAK